MIKAAVTFEDGFCRTFDFNQVVAGVKRKGKRPTRCEIYGHYEHESIIEIKNWVYCRLYLSMSPLSKELNFNVTGLDRDLVISPS